MVSPALALASLGLAAGEPALPVGLAPDRSVLEIALRLAALGLGLTLLLLGRRFDRLAVGSAALLFGAAVGLALLGTLAPAAGLVAGWLFFCFATAAYSFAPRLAVALACLWPLPALFGAHAFMAGSFRASPAALIALAVLGALLGGLFPRAGLALLSAGMGTLLLLLASPWEVPFWALAAVGGAAFLWQVAALPVFLEESDPWPEEHSFEGRRRRWLSSVAAGLWALLALATGVALLAPRAEGPSGGTARAEALRASGDFERPVLLLDRADALCLGGSAAAPSLAGGTGRFWDRLALPLLGRLGSPELRRARAVKDPAEIARLRRAAAITSSAFAAASAAIRPGGNEREVEAAVVGAFRRGGATGVAFPCVVGAGRNATLPHYMANDAPLERGLVVVDIGCSVGGYASDMTRTFPVAGRYTPEEREVLAAVLAAGDAARALLKPGASYSEMDRAARKSLEAAGFGAYILHGLGHGVGLDVHDPLPDVLEPGMVLTIEPGLYIPAGAAKPEGYWDLGARIEDTYLVTETGYEELTAYPKIPPEDAAAPSP